MYKKTLLLFIIIIMCFSICGCSGIKFVEKEESTETTAVDWNKYGDTTDVSEETTQIQTQQETTTSKTYDSSVKTFKTNGITFILCDTKTMYCVNICDIYTSPDNSAVPQNTINNEDKVLVYGISDDNIWAMVKYNGGSLSYMKNENLTDSEPTQPVTEAPTEKINAPAANSDDNNVAQQPAPTQAQTVAPGGIPYPSSPSSVSYNLGIKFADVNMSVYVVKDGTVLSTGPGKVAMSTGYTGMAVYGTGTVLHCTGIGENGYCRIELSDGTIGFVDSSSLTSG